MAAQTDFRLRDIHDRIDRACIGTDTDAETTRILHNSAERLATLHTNYGALSYENPEQLYLIDNAGAVIGYVSTVEIDDISPDAQDRIAEHVAAAAR